jgi:hypothetical protein
MSKPQWLKDKDAGVQHMVRELDYCHACIYYGPIVKYAKHRGKERVEVHACDINDCLNTVYSLACDDFMHE